MGKKIWYSKPWKGNTQRNEFVQDDTEPPEIRKVISGVGNLIPILIRKPIFLNEEIYCNLDLNALDLKIMLVQEL